MTITTVVFHHQKCFTIRRKYVLWLLPLVWSALMASGCGGRQNRQFALKSQNGKATIDMDRVTLIFEGVPIVLPQGQTGGGAAGSLAVAGSGSSVITVTAFGKTLTNSYNDGVNTMTFEGHSLRLLDAGTKLQIGTEEFDLTGEKKTVFIQTDGSAKLEEGN